MKTVKVSSKKIKMPCGQCDAHTSKEEKASVKIVKK